MWHRLLCDGILWYSMIWYYTVYVAIWLSIIGCGKEKHTLTCYGMVWYGMVWYGMVWYGMVWYGMVWYGMV